MLESFSSLFFICLVGFLAPFFVRMTSGKWIQASALVLLGGWLLGPNMLGLIHPDAYGMSFLRQIGLAFLFLMGGYSLQVKTVVGTTGRHAALSWIISFALGLLVAFGIPFGFSAAGGIAFAISLTSTSFSKVESDLKARNEETSPYGKVIESYGACGELLPVCAFALLIGEKSPVIELGVIVIFVVIGILGACIIHAGEKHGNKLMRSLRQNENASQLMLQFVIVLMVGLVCLGIFFGADMILAGFAAGFILRQLEPNEQAPTVSKLRAISTGFFIPVVFVLSGATVDIMGGLVRPVVVLGFIALLILVRGLPVLLTLSCFKETRNFDWLQKLSICAYSCMAMSTVVAMCDVAVESGDMQNTIASALIFAAALTTLVVPLITQALEHADARKKKQLSS